MLTAPFEPETVTNEVDTLLPYYVYELRDPRNNELFYVGKGTRSRVNHHDVPDEDADGTEKERRIAAIRGAGYHDCIRLIIGRYRTEEEAFAVEATLIKWIYGRDNLTNLVAGHRDKFIRSSQQRAIWDPSNDPAYEPVPQIDLPKRETSVRDGAFTDMQKQQAVDNAVEEKLTSLRVFLSSRIEDLGAYCSEVKMVRPQDPHILISGFNKSARIFVKLQLTGRAFTVTACPNGDKQAFTDLIARVLPEQNVANGSLYDRAHLHLHQLLAEQLGETENVSRSGVPVEKMNLILEMIRGAILLLTVNDFRNGTNQVK